MTALRAYRLAYAVGIAAWTCAGAITTGGMPHTADAARIETARAFVRVRADQDERLRDVGTLGLGLGMLAG